MILKLLNQNIGVLTVIFSAVVTIATVVYAILTWKLVSETKKMREAQTEPKVFVMIQPREEWINWIDLVIQNIGSGPAYNMKFEIDPDFEYLKGKFLSELGFIKNGSNHLAPNQKLQTFLTNMAENSDEKTKKSFKITVTYQNSVGKPYEDSYLIDFSQFIGLGQLGEPPLYKISKNIEKIQEDINYLSMSIRSKVEKEKKQLLERDNKPKKENKE